MPARKSAKKTSKGKRALKRPIVALYAVPIYDAIKRGDSKEMQDLAAKARKQISDVKAALATLEKKLASRAR